MIQDLKPYAATKDSVTAATREISASLPRLGLQTEGLLAEINGGGA